MILIATSCRRADAFPHLAKAAGAETDGHLVARNGLETWLITVICVGHRTRGGRKSRAGKGGPRALLFRVPVRPRSFKQLPAEIASGTRDFPPPHWSNLSRPVRKILICSKLVQHCGSTSRTLRIPPLLKFPPLSLFYCEELVMAHRRLSPICHSLRVGRSCTPRVSSSVARWRRG